MTTEHSHLGNCIPCNGGKEKYFRDLWISLHNYARFYPIEPNEEDVMKAENFMNEFRMKIPSNGCDCLKHWDSMVEFYRYNLSSRSTFCWWTVAAHDLVNIKLDKDVFHRNSYRHPLFDGLRHTFLA